MTANRKIVRFVHSYQLSNNTYYTRLINNIIRNRAQVKNEALRAVVLKLVGGTETHKFHTWIHRTLHSCKNKMCVVKFIFLLLLLKISCRRTPETDSPNPWVRSSPG